MHILLTNEKQELYEKGNICYSYDEKFEDKGTNDKKYRKVRDHCHYTGEYRGAANSICNIEYSIPKEMTVIFYIGSNYDDHFIIKEIAEEFEGQFNFLGENT